MGLCISVAFVAYSVSEIAAQTNGTWGR